MNQLFGVSMNLIMYVLVGALLVSLSTVVLVALRNRVMFKIGVRNIPRRRAQTTLIVLGLMLSTLIIAAAFTIGDTVDRSITGQVYRLLGSVDETVQAQANVVDESFQDEDPDSVVRDPSFDMTPMQGVIQSLDSNPAFDAVIPAYADIAVAINQSARQSSPIFTLTGLDAQRFGNLPDLTDIKSGKHHKVSDLGSGEIFINRSAADALNAKTGDKIDITALGKTRGFTVKAVVEDTRLAGSNGISIRLEGGVVPLNVAQEVFNAPGKITTIFVSNKGDTRGGLVNAKADADAIRAAGASANQPLRVAELKRVSVDFAKTSASFFTTIFLALGLFSIGAGILLIFMIFVMLAAERKGEMGMARAVGTKRLDIVQTFLSEGMTYNIFAAAVGCMFGVGVAVIIAKVMASLFADFNIEISPHVTARSLMVSYSLGVVLTFFTVTFASWRISNINIVRAIRDIPDPPMQKPDWRGRGFIGTLIRLFFKAGTKRAWVIRPLLLIVAVVLFTSAGGIGSTGIQVLVILIGTIVFLSFIFVTFQLGPLFVVGGVPLLIVGASGHDAAPLYLGLSLIPLGIALLARSFGANERITYTLAGLALIYIWLGEFEFHLIEKVFGKSTGDIEMFFLSGVMITVASTFLAVYNSDLIVALILRLSAGFSSLTPSIRMAAAYPLVNKTRTGMTMAMFCLVVFSLIVIASISHNFNARFVSDRSLAAFDVVVEDNPTNPISDLKGALSQAGSNAADNFDGVGTVSIAGLPRVRVCEVRPSTTCETNSSFKGYANYIARGVDAGFLSTAQVALQTRANGYGSDKDAWAAVASDPTFAIVDGSAVTGNFREAFIHSVDPSAKTMDPVTIQVVDRLTGKETRVKVIGIMEDGFSSSFSGIHVSSQAFSQMFGAPDYHRFYVKTRAGADDRQVARDIESALLATGAQADSMRYLVAKQSATITGFWKLIQGFMGLGLVVGVAAVGVIAFRTVVERRQQIGMLRALGYTKRMVGLTFMLESGFIAFGGIATGIIFGLILSNYLIRDSFSNQGAVSFLIPYGQVALIAGLAFFSALLMTLLPSQQASNIPIATALRYE